MKTLRKITQLVVQVVLTLCLLAIGYPAQVSEAAIWSGHPRFSPDGTKIAFVSDRGGERNIWLMNSDGTDPINLTAGLNNDYKLYPQWSPDGQAILFISMTDTEGDNTSDLWVISLPDTHAQNLTLDFDEDVSIEYVWSSSGTHIAFRTGKLAGLTILNTFWIIRKDGTELEQITEESGDYGYLRWIPNENAISFVSSPSSAAEQNLYKLDMATRETELLIENVSGTYTWSQDGCLVFARDADTIAISTLWLNCGRSQTLVKLSDESFFSVKNLIWFHDGQGVLFEAGYEPRILTLSFSERSLGTLDFCRQTWCVEADLSHDDQSVIFQSDHDGTADIWKIDLGEGTPTKLVD